MIEQRVEGSRNTACNHCMTPCASSRLSAETAQTFAPLSDLHGNDGITPEMTMLRFALKVYLLPALALLLGAVAGHFIADLTGWNDDGVSTLCGISGLLLTIGMLRYEARIRFKPEAVMEILES